MQLTLKHLKIIVVCLAVFFVLFGAWSIWNSVDYNKKKANFLKDKKEREGIIQTLTIEKEKAKTEAAISAEAAKVAAKERDKVRAELKEEREKVEEVVEEVERMEPGELVIVTQTLLKMGTEHIYRNPEGVQFSLAATKRLTVELTYLDFYRETERPKLIASDKKAKEEAVYWHNAYATLSEGALKNCEETVKEQAEQIAEDDRQLKRAEKQIKRASFKATVKTVVAVGVGYVIVKEVIIPLFRR